MVWQVRNLFYIAALGLSAARRPTQGLKPVFLLSGSGTAGSRALPKTLYHSSAVIAALKALRHPKPGFLRSLLLRGLHACAAPRLVIVLCSRP